MPHFPVTLWGAGSGARRHMYACELRHQSGRARRPGPRDAEELCSRESKGENLSLPGRGFARPLGVTVIPRKPRGSLVPAISYSLPLCQARAYRDE